MMTSEAIVGGVFMRVLSAVLLCTFTAVVQAATVTVNFDEDVVYGPLAASTYPESVTSKGYYFYTDSGFWPGLSDGLDGSNSVAYCPGCTADLTTVAGTVFDLHSVALQNYAPEPGDDFLTITGFLSGGGQVTVSLPVTANWGTFYFDALWTDLVSVQFGATTGTGFNAISIDNVTVSTIPVPAAVWLFGSALIGLGWIRTAKA